jgi:hypothetical protein
VQPLEPFLPFAIIAWVLTRLSGRVSIVGAQPQVDADRLARWFVDNLALRLDPELAVVAVRAAHDAYPFDLRERESFDPLPLVAYEPERADAAAVREGDVLAIRLQLPPGLLVLDGAVVVLELRVALLAALLLLAVLVEPRNGEPGARGGRLPCLGIEAAGERKLAGQLCAQTLQVIVARAARVHPQAQGLVADELHGADRLLDGGLLRRCPVQFVLVDQHRSRAAFPFSSSPLLFFSSAPTMEIPLAYAPNKERLSSSV